MKVTVDANLCQGHARCYAIAPELFDVDDYGLSTVIGDGCEIHAHAIIRRYTGSRA